MALTVIVTQVLQGSLRVRVVRLVGSTLVMAVCLLAICMVGRWYLSSTKLNFTLGEPFWLSGFHSRTLMSSSVNLAKRCRRICSTVNPCLSVWRTRKFCVWVTEHDICRIPTSIGEMNWLDWTLSWCIEWLRVWMSVWNLFPTPYGSFAE